MGDIGSTIWGALVIQSLTVFSLYLGLGLGLLATGILWRRTRRRHSPRLRDRAPTASRRTP